MNYKTKHRNYFVVLILLVVWNSCSFPNDFPLTINDIDTLTIYKHYRDSIAKASKTKETGIPKKIQNSNKNENVIEKTNNKRKWTICTGSFRVKSNAKRKFLELQKETQAYLITRDSMFFVTTGIFEVRDSAMSFKKENNNLAETYIMKVRPSDELLRTFPE